MIRRKRWERLNEEEYSRLVNGNYQYPKLLNKIEDEIFYFVIECVRNMIRSDTFKQRFNFKTKRENKYFDCIVISIILYKNNDANIDEFGNYGSSYVSENGFENRKFVKPEFELTIPLNEENRYNYWILPKLISHEIGLLYDEWQLMINPNKKYEHDYYKDYLKVIGCFVAFEEERKYTSKYENIGLRDFLGYNV